MLKPAREPDYKQLMLCKGARGLKTSCEPVKSQSSARDHWTIAGHLGFDCERESAFNDVEKARAFTLASHCYTNGMLSTHMQCSLVQHSHAVNIQLSLSSAHRQQHTRLDSLPICSQPHNTAHISHLLSFFATFPQGILASTLTHSHI